MVLKLYCLHLTKQSFLNYFESSELFSENANLDKTDSKLYSFPPTADFKFDNITFSPNIIKKSFLSCIILADLL